MRTRCAVAAALIAATAVLAAPTVDAYKRGVSPGLTQASCDSNDMVTVSWDKKAGEPTHLLVTVNFYEYFSPRIDIPKSRLAKRSWTFSFASYGDIEPGDRAAIFLNNDDLQGDYWNIECT